MVTVNSSLLSSLSSLDDNSLVCLKKTAYRTAAMDVLYRRHEDAMLGFACSLYFKKGDSYRYDNSLNAASNKEVMSSLKSEVAFAFAKAYDSYDRNASENAFEGKAPSFRSYACSCIDFLLRELKRKNSVHSQRYGAVMEEGFETRTDFRSKYGVDNTSDEEDSRYAQKLYSMVRNSVNKDSKEGEVLDAMRQAFELDARDYATSAAKQVSISRQYVHTIVKNLRNRILDAERKAKL